MTTVTKSIIETTIVCAILLTLIGCFLVFPISCHMREYNQNSAIRIQALEKGYAKYTNDTIGNMYFVWNDIRTNPPVVVVRTNAPIVTNIITNGNVHLEMELIFFKTDAVMKGFAKYTNDVRGISYFVWNEANK